MATAAHGCRECGRVISQIEAESVGICTACRRQGSGVTGARPVEEIELRLRPMKPTSEATPVLQQAPVRPIIKPRSGVAPKPQLRTMGRLQPAADQTATAPAPMPATAAQMAPPVEAPELTPPVAAPRRQPPERPNLRLRRSQEQEQEDALKNSVWQVHYGRKGLLRKEVIVGPFSWEELGEMVRNGMLEPGQRVRMMGENTWQMADQVDGLFSRLNLQALQVRREREMRKEQEISKADARGFFGIENSILNTFGPFGGIILMGIAVVWFLVGFFQYDVIFFYPPVLFLVGLVGLFRG